MLVTLALWPLWLRARWVLPAATWAVQSLVPMVHSRSTRVVPTYTTSTTPTQCASSAYQFHTLLDVFTYQVVDTAGLTSLATITITIQGRNDTPYDMAATGMTISEASPSGQSVGNITTSDVDAGDSLRISCSTTQAVGSSSVRTVASSR